MEVYEVYAPGKVRKRTVEAPLMYQPNGDTVCGRLIYPNQYKTFASTAPRPAEREAKKLLIAQAETLEAVAKSLREQEIEITDYTNA